MKSQIWITIFIMLLISTMSLGQVAMLEKKVTIQYFDVELEEALDGISKDFDVNFTYSMEEYEMNQKVSANVENAPLSIALEDLLEETDITFASIGDQVVLKVDMEKRRLLSQKKQKKKEEPQIIKIDVPAPTAIGSINWSKVESLNSKEDLELGEMVAGLNSPYLAEVIIEEEEKEVIVPQKRFAQVTLFGDIGTNGNKSDSTTNQFSANILWGKNRGVSGTEVGGLINITVKDVKGIQVAGVGNRVRGQVDGTQVGGIFNSNRGETKGIQVAGMFNTTKEMTGVQVAGSFNVAKKGSTGIQVAGFGNYAGKDSKGGVQVASLYNINKGKSNIQVSPLFNYGKKVKGFQVGLINVADTVGASIGLINIVRNGYNRLEISTNEVIRFNAEMKLGSRKFYNIFYFGFRPQRNDAKHFAYGYGFGLVTGSPKSKWKNNFELVAKQINGYEKRNNPDIQFANERQKLNLLTQLRWTIDKRLRKSGRASIFFGPTLNFMTSRMVNPTTGEYQFDILPKPFFEADLGSNRKRTYMAGWVGFNAGFRF